jgi:GGDEF domain-containing protein
VIGWFRGSRVASRRGHRCQRNGVREVDEVEPDGAMELPDRDAVLGRLDALLAQGQRPAVYLVAVDGYEVLEARDPDGTRTAMRSAAGRLDRLVRSSDVLGAIAPGTFVLVGSNVEPSVAGALVERVEGALALPLDVGGEPLSLKVDVGVAFATSASSGADLLERADADLLRSRRR